MTPASSKYDAYVRGQATLTEQERRGLEVFKDRRRGACSGCHRMAETSTNPAESMFTDYGYDAVALPRNRELPGNRRRRRPSTSGFASGRTPQTPVDATSGSARASARRRCATSPSAQSFGHNGVYKSLREVVTFYAHRAVAPGPRLPGRARSSTTCRPSIARNINIYAPVYNRREGAPPPMSDADIDASSRSWGRSPTRPTCRPQRIGRARRSRSRRALNDGAR